MGRATLVVTLALCAVAAGLGLSLGHRSDMTETQVIEAGATLYRQETGGAAVDCVGLPGQGAVWVEVRCGTGDGLRVYRFDQQGGPVRAEGRPEA